jgi:putative oxidoreductase
MPVSYNETRNIVFLRAGTEPDDSGMKILTNISRFLLGLISPAFGLLGALFVSRHLLAVATLQVISGALLLVNRYVPLALTILGPIIVKILLYHALVNSNGFGIAAFITVLWVVVFWSVHSAFAGLFEARVETNRAPVRRHTRVISPA